MRPPAPTLASTTEAPPALGDLRVQLQEYESRRIRETLQAAGWNQSEAARRLGMPIRTLSHKAKMMGLKKPGA